MPAPVHPVIFVPGITATALKDEYPLPPETVWSVLSKDFERITLHPDDLRYEARQPVRVIRDQPFEIAYKELIAELRHNLTPRPDKPVPVYAFGYDWRRPLAETEAALGEFIGEVIDRTKLLKHYHASGYADDPKVHLIGHSMGGLIIAGHLKQAGKRARVAKVATLASPFRGSFEAVLKITTGTADLGGGDSGSREREAARVTPGLYHLLPSMPDAITIENPALGSSLYQPELWQPGVHATIAQFVRLHGLGKGSAEQRAADLFASLLTQAREHRARLESLKLTDAGLQAKDWLCVVGVDCKTRTGLRIRARNGKPEFELESEDRQNRWADPEATPAQRAATGDGTVPFAGAVPAFLDQRHLVCVTPDDFGYWEIQDRVLAKAAGFHGILPNMDMLHRLVARHLTGAPDHHGNTWGRPAPGVAPSQWQPPLPLTLKP